MTFEIRRLWRGILLLALVYTAFGSSAFADGRQAPAPPPRKQPAQDQPAQPTPPQPIQGQAKQPAQPQPPRDNQFPAPKPVPGQTPPIAPNVVETPIPAAVILPPGTAANRRPDVPNRPLTANEAVRIALRYQPNVTIARASIAAAAGITQQVRAATLPSVTVTGSYTNVQSLSSSGGAAVGTTTGSTGTGSGGSGSNGTGGTGSTGTGSTGTGGTGAGSTGSGSTGSGSTSGTGGTTTTVPINASGQSSSLVASGFQATANLRQLIFDFNHTRDLVREASLQERAAVDNLARVQSDLVLQVKQAFYLYVQYSQLVSVNEENVANRQAQLALAQARLNSGLGLPSDVVTAETALSEAATNLLTARNSQGLARISLALIMGIDPRTPIDAAPSGEPPIATGDVQSLVTTALRQRPEILQINDLLNAARYGVSAAQTTNAPSVSGNLGFVSRGENFPPNNNIFSVGVTLQWNPFDGGLTAGRVQTARANVDSLQAQLTNTQLGVVSDVSQAYVNLRNAEQRVVTANAEVTNAVEGVRIAQGRFSRGLGLFLDIINAQAALVTARSNLAAAQFSVDQARAALLRAIGTPLPR